MADGIAISVVTLPPPPDWPNMVTLPGLPPNAAMLSLIQPSAATMSCMPTLLELAHFSPAPRSARCRKPNRFRRWFTDTTTTSSLRARFVPSYSSQLPEPPENPPPCSHTITGRLPVPRPGVKTLMLRQSSPIGSRRSSDHTSEIGPSGSCGARWPPGTQSRTPVQAAGLTGGMKRLAPAVDAPYGTP